MKPAIRRFDSMVTNAITKLFGARVWFIFTYLTHIGDPRTVTLIAGALWLMAVLEQNLGLAIAAVIIPLTIIVGFLLKISFERARPMTDYARAMSIQTFSFPSGHSSGATVCYLLVAWLASQSLIVGGAGLVAVAATLPIIVGVSRVYLGAHFPSDVLAGWLLGLIGAIVAITVMS